MPRLEYRWRTQRNAIRIVNCRIPWVIRSLNALCTLGVTREYTWFSVFCSSCQLQSSSSMALVCAAGSAPPAHEWHQGSLLATRVIAARLRFSLWLPWRLTRYLRFLAASPLTGSRCFQYKPELRWGYPLNLSISVSGGRETNQDSLSKGDWRGKSSGWKSGTCPWIVVFRGSTSDGAGVSLLEKSTRKGESPVSLASRHVRCSSDESRSLGLERKWVVNFIQS